MNAQNMKLNGVYGQHARPKWKKYTSKKRRTRSKKVIRLEKYESGY